MSGLPFSYRATVSATRQYLWRLKSLTYCIKTGMCLKRTRNPQNTIIKHDAMAPQNVPFWKDVKNMKKKTLDFEDVKAYNGIHKSSKHDTEPIGSYCAKDVDQHDF